MPFNPKKFLLAKVVNMKAIYKYFKGISVY